MPTASLRLPRRFCLLPVLAALLSATAGAEAPPPPPPTSASAMAQAPAARSTLKDSVQQAVLTQPEVQFRWHAFLASDFEHDAAFGGYLPRLDLSAGRGKESRDDPLIKRDDYTRTSSSLTLTQMLYDGFYTRNEVKRLDHARMSKLFELQDVTENTALEAVRAYLDVLRFRRLVALTEENYVQHRSVLEQIQLKVKAGVGRRVDLEQASGRLALAESNLIVDVSNLHDVSARFQRLVGVPPAVELIEPAPLNKGLPGTPNAAQSEAQLANPALRAAVENVRSADAAHSTRASNFQPRFDLRLREDRGRDLNGLSGVTDNTVAEVVATWNLFNGFTDVNRRRQFAEQINVARDLRDKTCRDLRQTLAIAYNDTRKLSEQLGYLDQHQLSIEKARDAYRKQFDIGQRTLLDVLDTENELFQARRAYANAEVDLQFAYARAQAGVGRLLQTLGVSHLDEEASKQLKSWAAEGDGAQQCPPDAPLHYVLDKQALDERAAQILRELAPRTTDPTALATVTAASAAVEMAPMPAVAQALKSWAAHWSNRNAQAYLDSYATTFVPADGTDLATWSAKRKAALERAGDIRVELADVKLEVKDATHASSTFLQRYSAAQYQDVVRKTLNWERIDGRWLITAETAVKQPLSAWPTTLVAPASPAATPGAAAGPAVSVPPAR